MRSVEIYRDREEGLRLRWEALALRAAEAGPADEAAKRVYRDRAARAAAGLGAVAGGLAMAALVALEGLVEPDDLRSGHATEALLAGWVVALVIYLAVSAAASSRLRRLVARLGAPSGDLERDLERLERAAPGDEARAAADRLERASVALPLMGLALLAPLTIHLAVYRVFMFESRMEGPHAYDKWIAMSLVIVGHAHLVLALCAWLYARKLRREPAWKLRSQVIWRDGWHALLWATLAGAVPGALLFLIPPLLVLATGALFVPLAFWAMGRRVLLERAALGIPEHAAPLAA